MRWWYVLWNYFLENSSVLFETSDTIYHTSHIHKMRKIHSIRFFTIFFLNFIFSTYNISCSVLPNNLNTQNMRRFSEHLTQGKLSKNLNMVSSTMVVLIFWKQKKSKKFPKCPQSPYFVKSSFCFVYSTPQLDLESHFFIHVTHFLI